jgi:hypothetical protein
MQAIKTIEREACMFFLGLSNSRWTRALMKVNGHFILIGIQCV